MISNTSLADSLKEAIDDKQDLNSIYPILDEYGFPDLIEVFKSDYNFYRNDSYCEYLIERHREDIMDTALRALLSDLISDNAYNCIYKVLLIRMNQLCGQTLLAKFNLLFEQVETDEYLKIIRAVLNYYLQLFSGQNHRDNKKTYLFSRENKDNSGRAGFGRFMYEFNDLLIILIECVKGKLVNLDLSDVHNFFFNIALFHRRTPGRSRRLPVSRGQRDYRRVHNRYLNIENNTALKLGSGMFNKQFPYFDPNLIKLIEGNHNITYLCERPECDFFISLITQRMGYFNPGPFSLELDYNHEPKIQRSMIQDIENGGEGLQISELLGRCRYSTDGPASKISITLFMKSILSTAKSIDVDPVLLMVVVYIHELVHYTYFSGQSLGGRPFYPFSGHSFDARLFGDVDFHETLAQLITYHIVKKDSDLKSVFDRLNEDQPEEYRKFRKLQHLSYDEINAVLEDSNETDRKYSSLFKPFEKENAE